MSLRVRGRMLPADTDYPRRAIPVALRRRAKSPTLTPSGLGAVDRALALGYQIGMKSNTKSSITLPRNEVRLVEELQKRLKAKSKVEVVRRGLLLLKESTDRQALRAQYEDAARRVRASAEAEIEELDHLAGEGLP